MITGLLAILKLNLKAKGKSVLDSLQGSSHLCPVSHPGDSLLSLDRGSGVCVYVWVSRYV